MSIVDKVLHKVFGTPHERKVKRLRPIIAEINKTRKELEHLSDKELALKYLRLAVKNQSKDPYSYFSLGELYFDRKEYDNAEKIIQQGLDLGVRTDFFLEDKRGRWHLKELLKKIKAKRN